MERVTQPYAEVWTAARLLIPDRVLDLLDDVELLAGVDPVFVGLHRYRDVEGELYPYSAVAHAVYPYHQTHIVRARRRPTIVLPVAASLETVIHEFGHMLHLRLGFDLDVEPLTTYACRDRYEAFAEAFRGWILARQGDRRWCAALGPWPAIVAMFEAIDHRSGFVL